MITLLPEAPEQVIDRLEKKAEAQIDNEIKAAGYSDITDIVACAIVENQWQAEAQTLLKDYLNKWEKAEGILKDIKAKKKPIPTEEEFINEVNSLDAKPKTKPAKVPKL